MKKRIICLVMALVMALCASGATAAQYDSLPEKMRLQLELSGLKGSVTMTAKGESEWVSLVNGLFRDATLEIRGITSNRAADENGAPVPETQYQAYFQRGETQLGLTQLFTRGDTQVLQSVLAPTNRLRFAADKSLLEQLAQPNAEGNPDWYSALMAFTGIDEQTFNTVWAPAIAPYEQALELWLSGYASAPEVLRDADDETRMQVSYEIPAEAVTVEAAALVRSMLKDETLRSLLASLMTEEQVGAYLNPNWADYYAERLSGLKLEGTVKLERQMSLVGETIYTKILLPLPAEQTGYDTLMIHRDGDILNVTLAGGKDTLIVALTEMEQGVSGISLKGSVERQMAVAGEGDFKADYTLLRTHRENVDDEGREHEYENLLLTLAPEEGDALELSLTAHFHSKSANRNPTTLEVTGALILGADTLEWAGTFKTTSPWVLQAFDETDAKDWASLTESERSETLAAYSSGALQLVTQLATGTDLTE